MAIPVKNYILQPLGTPESALEACVSLLSAVTGQREDYMAGWLDLYYQVRCSYERERAAAPEPVKETPPTIVKATVEIPRENPSTAAAVPLPLGKGGKEGADGGGRPGEGRGGPPLENQGFPASSRSKWSRNPAPGSSTSGGSTGGSRPPG